MSGVKGQGKGNGAALKHGQRSLLGLVQRSQSADHPVLRIIADKAEAYAADRGGPAALSLMERETLRHAATLGLLADLQVARIVNPRGQARRMSAAKFRDLALAYGQLVAAHGRLCGMVGLERKAKELPSLSEIRRQYGASEDSPR